MAIDRTTWRGACFALAAAALAGTSSLAMAQQSARPLTGARLHAGTLEVPLNKSQVVNTDRAIAKAMIGNDEIADILPITDRSVYVLGKKMGTTSLTLYDSAGRVITVMDVAVGPDVEALGEQLREYLPDGQIQARMSNESIVLTGLVNDAGSVDRAMQLAKTFAGDKVVNMISLGSSQQVMLEVRFAEVTRSVNRDVGVRASASSRNGNFSGVSGAGSQYIPGATQTNSTSTLGNSSSNNGTTTANSTNITGSTNTTGSSNSSGLGTSIGAAGATLLSGTAAQFQNPSILDGRTLSGTGSAGFTSGTSSATGSTSGTTSDSTSSGSVGSVIGAIASSAMAVTTSVIGDVMQMGSITDGFGIFRQRFSIGGVAINAVLNAMESKGLAKTLAQPTLVAISGERASFLAGGEFPVPVAQSGSGGNNANITVEFKPFGISLAFTPTVLGDRTIHLIVEPEVSAIDPSASFTLGNLSIPGLRTRRASTTIELRDGESFAIAGLISKDFQTTVKQIPLLGSLPIIGALFRSSAFQKGETELMIVVTPHLVAPLRPEQVRLPTDAISDPDGAATVFLGRPTYNKPLRPDPRAAAPATTDSAAPQSRAPSALPQGNAGGVTKESDYAY